MTLSSPGLIEAETVDHPEPEDILVSVAAKEERILKLIQEMQKEMEGTGQRISEDHFCKEGHKT